MGKDAGRGVRGDREEDSGKGEGSERGERGKGDGDGEGGGWGWVGEQYHHVTGFTPLPVNFHTCQC